VDILAVIGGALMGAGVAAQLGYWIGRRERRRREQPAPELAGLRDVEGAARALVDSGWEIEVAVEDGDDPDELARFLKLWEQLEESVKRSETASETPA